MADYEKQRTEGMRRVIDNDDLLEEIILRLPLSDIARSKAVSKRWDRLIASYSFRLRHSNPSNKSMIMLQVSKKLQVEDCRLVVLLDHHGSIPPAISAKTPPPELCFPFIADDERCYFQIEHSSNGLLLLSKIDTDPFILGLYICNPLTKEYIQLPPRKYEDLKGVDEIRMKVVFDPVDYPHYKVISINGIKRHSHIQGYTIFCVEVYSSKSQSWVVTKEFNYCPEFRYMYDSAVVNDFLYWPTPHQSINIEHAFCFDSELLHMRSLSAPTSGHEDCCVYFGESSGHLYLVENPGDVDMLGTYFIWEIKNIQDSACSWVLKFQFQLEDPIKILHIHSNDEENYLQVFFIMGNLIKSLKNTDFNAAKRLEDVAISDWLVENSGYYWCIVEYTPTLLPVACPRIEGGTNHEDVQ